MQKMLATAATVKVELSPTDGEQLRLDETRHY